MRSSTPLPPLKAARIHEATGASARSFACLHANDGPLLWLRESWQKVELFPETLQKFLLLDRLTLITPPTHTDLLAVAEEALKEPLVQMVVLEISSPLNLREGRRLQLAAQAGGTLAICILPNEAMGSNATESRWLCTPVYNAKAPDSTLMHWQLKKNKSGILGAWHVRWDDTTHHIDLAPTPPL